MHRRKTRSECAAHALSSGVALILAAWNPAPMQAQESQSPLTELNLEALSSTYLDSLLRPLVIDRMTDRYIAGAAIAVVHHGRVVYLEGFGDREVYSEDPVDAASTIFRIGSITKVLTGIAVMQLVDRGLVDLEADVNRYLTDVRVPDTFAEPVRVRHLLTHTAGFDQIGLDRHARSEDAVRPLGEWLSENLVRIRPPGMLTAYDTYGITLAGRLVESVSGLGFEDYLRRHLFEPLRMDRTGITVRAEWRGDVAVGYGFAGHWEVLPWEYMNTAPASTVNSTAADMARLMTVLLNGGQVDGVRVLSESSVREMLTRQFTNHPDQPGYGYTFFEDPWRSVPRFSHGGSMSGYSAMLMLVPDYDIGIYVAYNQESDALVNTIMPALFESLLPGAQPLSLGERYAGDIDLARFAGLYADNVYHHGNPATGWRRRPTSMEVEELPSGEEVLVFQGMLLRPVGPLTFQREDGQLVSFRENEDGEISHMFVRQQVYEGLPDRPPQ